MASENGDFVVLVNSVETTGLQRSFKLQDNKSKYDNTDKYSFQTPMTSNRPKGSGENTDGRKRISCNFCRRRKVKCDKKDPCGQCSISFRDCVYTERSNCGTKRTKSSSRLDAMEKRLKVIESNQLYHSPVVDTTTMFPSSALRSEFATEIPHIASIAPIPKNSDLEEIGKCATARHVIEHGEIEFHGTSADRTFMEGLMEKLGDNSVTHQRISIDTSVPGLFHTDGQDSEDIPLPGRDQAMRLVEAAVEAQILLHIIHRPSFEFSFNLIYSLEPSEYSSKERRFLPLLYAVLAYGSLFVDPYAERWEYDQVITRASRYFIKSKQLQDIASCNDLISLQAIVFKNLFLLYTTRTPSCYTYLCTSMSVALRMGLHRSLNSTQDMVSREISKRVFLALKLLSSEVATCMGLPTLVNEGDFDQELPLEVNDIYIQKGNVTQPPSDEVCHASGAICYSRLHNILHKVLKDIYPHKSRVNTDICGSMKYVVKVDTIRRIEDELEKWAKAIPLGYRLGTYYKEQAVQRAQYVLALTFSYIQLRLYRPFLHYGIESSGKPEHQHSAELSPCAAACIQACQNIIGLCEDICRRGLLTEASWPIIRILTSCMLTLLYITLLYHDAYGEDILFKSFASGRKIINILEKRSYQACRSKTIFKIIISSLSINFGNIRDKLMKYESEAPDIRQCDLSTISDDYTAFLGEQVFTLSSQKQPRSRNYKFRTNDGLKNAGNRLEQISCLNGVPKDTIQLQSPSFLDQFNKGSAPVVSTSDPILSDSLKAENSPLQGQLGARCVSGYSISSVPSPPPGNVSETEQAEVLQQDEPNRPWMHAFDAMNSGGSVYNPVKDLLEGVGPYMDDMNEYSDIWDWF